MYEPCVVDLSHWNPTPNWTTLRQTGVVGIIHKATEGYNYVDPTLFDRARAALDAGLLWSTYHFMRPGSNMATQMDWYLDTIDPVQGERVCLDHEDAEVSLRDLEAAVSTILDKRPDLQITIYSGHVIKEQLGPSGIQSSPILADNTSLWIAHYTTDVAPTWPENVWPEWSLWQYTDKAKVPGISQPVDGDHWNGDEEALRLWFGPALPDVAPIPPPRPAIETVDIAIRSTPGVSVSVTLDGEIVLAAKA